MRCNGSKQLMSWGKNTVRKGAVGLKRCKSRSVMEGTMYGLEILGAKTCKSSRMGGKFKCMWALGVKRCKIRGMRGVKQCKSRVKGG